MPLDEQTYVDSFKPDMMDIVYAWCQGAKFNQICKMTDIFEGSIIRSMRRLEELLRQLVAAAKSIGNTDLENKFAEGKLVDIFIGFNNFARYCQDQARYHFCCQSLPIIHLSHLICFQRILF